MHHNNVPSIVYIATYSTYLCYHHRVLRLRLAKLQLLKAFYKIEKLHIKLQSYCIWRLKLQLYNVIKMSKYFVFYSKIKSFDVKISCATCSSLDTMHPI
jgi:hypothetical protein